MDIIGEYEAPWICHLFGLFDCLVPSISLGRVGMMNPANGGAFDITIPDFSSDPLILQVVQSIPVQKPSTELGTVQLVLHDKILGRPLAAIEPKGEPSPDHGLFVQPTPSEVVAFRRVPKHNEVGK